MGEESHLFNGAPELHQPADIAATPAALLRRSTRVAHEQLEASSAIMSERLTRDGYTETLLAFARVHQAIDRVVASQLGHIVDTGPLMRSVELAGDLAELGEVMPAAATLDVPPTIPAAWGVLYVSEGSRLGGRVVSDHVRDVLGEDTPLAFFDGGSHVGRRWSATRDLLNEHLGEGEDTCAAACAARVTFATMGRELGRRELP